MPLNIQFPAIDSTTQQFAETKKLINNEEDVVRFHSTIAYARLTAFLHFICDAVPEGSLSSPPPASKNVQALLDILSRCDQWVTDCPPHTGARRFGNLAFREWHSHLDSESEALVSSLIQEPGHRSLIEVVPYFTGSFGSAQRLDYGTGHELSFFAFLCTLFQLDVLSLDSSQDAQGVGLLVYPAYLSLIQKLVVRYTLEPAGSHGVWGLDDHFAMPYLLGAAQLSRLEPETFPTPASITSKKEVEEFRTQNLYFNAIGFINDVKKGPFWEHSPMLYDISGINNWAKISTGMRKMYNVEVLGKFPVVQHFPFGECFFPFTPMDPSQSNKSDVDAHSMEDPKQVEAKTKSLHVSDLRQEREALQADTPIPEDQPTKILKQRQPDQGQSERTAAAAQVPTSAPWKTGSSTKRSSTGPVQTLTPTPRIPVAQSAQKTSAMSNPKSTSSHESPAAPFAPGTGRQIGLEHDGRTRVPVTHPDSSLPLSAHPHVTTIPKASITTDSETEEQANVDGMEEGLGIEGQPGTKAPFSAPRTIHPVVLESMRQRGELQ